ncbi:hypothetical protein LTR51_008249 [Lithohypha guttulata]|nr:hypothetical protein LTR51_008249 [Lithohypha guttulata]
MGYIYSQAQEVIAVLSPTVRPVLDYMFEHQALNRDHIPLLEAEDWVTRAWTYQEAVNARSLSVTCRGYDHDALPADQFLNHVGYAISQLKLPASVLRQRYPRLDAVEDLCDYLIAGYAERSALQIMAMMDRRMQHHPDDHFFAMIGALSQIRASEVGTQNPWRPLRDGGGGQQQTQVTNCLRSYRGRYMAPGNLVMYVGMDS